MIGWFISVNTFQPIILIYIPKLRGTYYFCYDWGFVLIYRPLSYPLKSVVITLKKPHRLDLIVLKSSFIVYKPLYVQILNGSVFIYFNSFGNFLHSYLELPPPPLLFFKEIEF